MKVEQSLKLLRDIYGFSSFRGQQQEIIEHVGSGQDALVIMPTGGGKSLCYQLPALVREGMGIVISPLIALMHDQVQGLKRLGLRAACLNSSLQAREAMGVKDAIRRNDLDLLYVAPERFMLDSFLELISTCPIALFAIDEAHCVSQWGHDFRPEYSQLKMIGERFPGIPRIALTATADPPTRRDIARLLGFENAQEFLGGFDRPNITYRIQSRENGNKQLLKFIKEEQNGASGIVYCLSRNSVEETAEWLSEQGLQALPYHAGMDDRDRHRNQDTFLNEEGVIMVATIAFGMGIDKPNVRFVAHMSLPKTIEAYYQETGRAGRDGLPAVAWMVYGISDIAFQRRLINSGEATPERKMIEHRKLSSLLGFVESTTCRRQVLLNYFGEERNVGCNNCDNCLEPKDTWDGTKEAQMALSCIYRTGQSFGYSHIVDVVRGEQTEKTSRFRHHQLKTFGVGKHLSKREWSSVLRQLVATGFLTVDIEVYGALKLTSRAERVLKGEETVTLRRDQSVAKSSKKRTPTSSKDQLVADLLPSQKELFARMRKKRLDLAKEEGVRPYVIFSDVTLLELARKQPMNLAALSEVYGIGKTKLEKYGQIFLELINDF